MPFAETPLDLPLPPGLLRVLASGPPFDAAYLVGGGVRDALLGRPTKDLDVEVHGATYEQLESALRPFGGTDVVGRAFGVVKLRTEDGDEFDFGVPRRDSRVGPGHRGFRVETDPTLDLAQASARRDFTVNALAFDPRRGVVLDHHGGLADLAARRLRHTSEAFAEDPLRVLRGVQLASRLDFGVAPETVALAASIADRHGELPVERLWGEWHKWASRAIRPSAGLTLLADSGWIVHYPELDAMRGTPQDPEWHPEGDVWTHTGHALDALANDAFWRAADEEDRAVLCFAVLLHDAGKPACTRRERRGGVTRIVSPGHEAAGLPLVDTFLARIGAPVRYGPMVHPLVAEHMAHLQAATPRAIRRLSVRLAGAGFARLAAVIRADVAGRPPLRPEPPASLATMLDLASELEVAEGAPAHVLMGRHLLERGWPEGPEIGELLAAAYEAQLDGVFTDLDGALRWLDGRARAN
jgi:tRNA nucleotidyltransferase (CCA-adding enzyme)